MKVQLYQKVLVIGILHQRGRTCGWVCRTRRSRMKSATFHTRWSCQPSTDDTPQTPPDQLNSAQGHRYRLLGFSLKKHFPVHFTYNGKCLSKVTFQSKLFRVYFRKFSQFW